MLKTWLHNWLYGTVFTAVEHTDESNNTVLQYLVLKNKKDTLKIIDKGQVGTIEDLNNKIPESCISLVINNEHVTAKVLNGALPKEDVLSLAFPALRLSEFYYNIVQNDALTLVSICRKEHVEAILNLYEANKLHVVSFSLGNSAIIELEDYIQSNSITTTNAFVAYNMERLNEIELTTVTNKSLYAVNDLELSNKTILALGSIINGITKSEKIENNFDELLSKNKEDHQTRRIYKRLVQVALGVLLTSLVLNILFFSHYQNKLTVLEQDDISKQQTKTSLHKIEKEVTNQNKLITEIFHSSSSHTTYILDDLVSVLPQSINLSSIQYQPLLKQIKPKKTIRIDTNTMLIKGSSYSDVDFTNWIKETEQKNWVVSVVVLDYGTKKTTTDFSIKINIKDDWKK